MIKMTDNPPRKDPPISTQRVLFSESAGICSLPDCNMPIVFDKKVGKGHYSNLAHIEAYSKKGPRFNPKLSVEQRNSEENIIIVCANCHKKIDTDTETYTVEALKKIKQNHIARIKLIKENMIHFDYDDLIYASRSILDSRKNESKTEKVKIEYNVNYDIKPIDYKIRKNDMSFISKNNIVAAMLQQETVVEFISHMSKENENFAYELLSTLKEHYNKFKIEYSGDMLLTKLYTQFIKPLSDKQQSACLAIIVYFFTICELFEK